MRRKDKCPECYTINPDNWVICKACGHPAPPPISRRPNAKPARPYKKDITKPDLFHLLWCLKRVTVHNLADPEVLPDLFWSRHAGLVQMFQRDVDLIPNGKLSETQYKKEGRQYRSTPGRMMRYGGQEPREDSFV